LEAGKDERLLEKARRAEPEALAALCSEYYPKLLKYMHYRVDAASAEDLVGEVFVRVLRGIHGQKGSFPAWLYRIAANVVVDHGRKKRTKRETQMSDAHENPAPEPSLSETVARPAASVGEAHRRAEGIGNTEIHPGFGQRGHLGDHRPKTRGSPRTPVPRPFELTKHHGL